jgi:hypothetical protein
LKIFRLFACSTLAGASNRRFRATGDLLLVVGLCRFGYSNARAGGSRF